MKSIFEQSGGAYTMQGDYRLPNLTVPAEDERPLQKIQRIFRCSCHFLRRTLKMRRFFGIELLF